jgi:hypothetical protein
MNAGFNTVSCSSLLCAVAGSYVNVGQTYVLIDMLTSPLPPLPTAPTHPSVMVKGSTITVRWNVPVSSGPGRIAHYTVMFSGVNHTYSVTGRTWLNRITGFSENKHYTISITATNSAGTGPATNLRHVKG